MKKVSRTNQVTFSRAEIIEALQHQGWQIPTDAQMRNGASTMPLDGVVFKWSDSQPVECIAMKAKEA